MTRRILSLAIASLALRASADICVSTGFYGWNRYMEHMDKYGRPVEFYRVGEFDLADARMPLYVYWSSAESCPGSLLGYGWHVPWFESRMIPIDATRYEMRSPFGECIRFAKDAKNQKLYRLGRNACALVSKSDIKVFMRPEPAARPDMVFVGGRLEQFVYAAKTFRIQYENGRFRKMTCGGRTVLSVERCPSDKQSFSVFFNGRKDESFSFTVGTKFLCVGMKSDKPSFAERETLVRMRTAGGEDFRFSYGDSGICGMMSDGRNTITWNPKTRRILTRGEWIYDVSKHDPDRGKIHLCRRNADGVRDEHSYDARSGHRVRMVRGVRYVERLFTSGKLRGMLRWKEEHVPGADPTRTEYSYDENQRLLYYKIINKANGTYAEYWNNTDGKIVRFRTDGDDSTLKMYRYAEDGSRIDVRPNTESVSITYQDAAT